MPDQKLPMIYDDPNIRQDVFDRMSAEMKKLYLKAFSESRFAEPRPAEKD